jgi:ATP-binding cassette subfamily B protein
MVESACSSAGWREWATLDAATRMINTLVEGRAVRRGREARQLLQQTIERADQDGIPISFWWVWAGDAANTLTVRGAPIVRFGTEDSAAQAALVGAPTDRAPTPRPPAVSPSAHAAAEGGVEPDMGAPFRRHLARHGLSPARLFWHLLTVELGRAPLLLALAVGIGALIAIFELLMLQGMLHAAQHLALTYQRIGGVLVVVVLSLLALAVDGSLASVVARLGRRLELRMRAALFERLPRLPDEYLRTRSTADMAQRGHALHQLHDTPLIARRALESLATLLASGAGIAWLYPEGAGLALAASMASVAVPALCFRLGAERSRRAHAHLLALDQFYLDALLGVIPIRVHGAERAVRRQHEALLVEWKRAMHATLQRTTLSQAVLAVLGLSVALLLTLGYARTRLALGGVLLLVYWADRLRISGAALVDTFAAYDFQRHNSLRFFAPLAAQLELEQRLPAPGAVDIPDCVMEAVRAPAGMSIAIENVSVLIAQRPLLRDVQLLVPGGQHVGVVGCSGAGKSSLAGLLLGWLTPTQGRVSLDGKLLDAQQLPRSRAETVWVDPAVQLWNESVIHNVLYGAGGASLPGLAEALEDTRLLEVLEELPDGLRSQLGEGGARLSGGQGQRVRLARAWMQRAARLVILDEPFRGLERAIRHELLLRVRARFRAATLLFISHDIEDTRELDRVLVVEEGRVVEDGPPAQLLSEPSSRYCALLASQERQKQVAWGRDAWRRARMQAGQLEESA